jgi:hypothetical protein
MHFLWALGRFRLSKRFEFKLAILFGIILKSFYLKSLIWTLVFEKNQNCFYSPFTFRSASSLRPTLRFLGTGPLHSAFRPKPAHLRASPFLLPPAWAVSAVGPHSAARRLPTHAMELESNCCTTSFNSPPSMGAALYPSFLRFKNSKPSPLNNARPLGSSPGRIKGTSSTLQPASPRTLLFSSPPHSICCRTKLSLLPLCLIVVRPHQASHLPSVPSVRFPATSSCRSSSRGELWCRVVMPGEFTGETRPRPYPWSIVDHGAARTTDPWTRSTGFILYWKIFHFLLYSEKLTLSSMS